MRTGTTRLCQPEDRMSKSTGYPYTPWDAPDSLKNDIAAVFAYITAEWEWGEMAEKNIFIATRLDAILRKSKLLALVFELVGSWDLTLWMLCQMTRAIGSAVSGNNGKGKIINLMIAALGSHPDGYYGQLEFEKHFLGTGVSKYNVNSPDIAALEGKRLVVVNETPGTTTNSTLNTALIKRILSLDAQIQATAKYKDPCSWTMRHLIFMADTPQVRERPGPFHPLELPLPSVRVLH
jgi:hypothetical protein